MPATMLTAATRQTVGSDELWFALDALIMLQAHYATLVTQYDGRKRIVFESAETWIERLRDMDRLEG